MRGWVCLLYMLLASPAQSSRARVPWISRPYFTLSVLRLPFSSPPTTCRVTVEVFDPSSTWVALACLFLPVILMQHGHASQ
jgi:hypothetical protein